MTMSREEARRQLREKYRQSYASLKPGAAIEAPRTEAPDPEMAALAEIRKTLSILSTATHLAPSSVIEHPTLEEKELHEIRTELVMRFSASESSQNLSQRDPDAMRETLRGHFEPVLQRAIADSRLSLSIAQRESLLVSILDEIVGCGPIEPLLRDPDISEIMVNGPRKVFVEKRGRIEISDRKFYDDAHMMNILSRIVSRIGRNIDLSNPHVDARLPDGSRVHAIIPPLALDGPVLTIRKFKTHSLQMEDLLGYDALTPEIAYFLGACVKARLNIIVAGGTGTGKTTILNVLSTLVPPEQRIITIEDAAELKVREHHPHVVRLESRPVNTAGKGQVTIRDLVRDALRMRPDRIIVGECRGGEAMDMLQAMNTGHDGSMTTAHSNSAADLLHRVESMCLMAGMDMPLSAIRSQIASAIEMIVFLRRYPDGSRKVAEISEIAGMKDGEIALKTIFRFEITSCELDGKVLGEYHATDKAPAFLQKFETAGLAFPSDIFTDID